MGHPFGRAILRRKILLFIIYFEGIFGEEGGPSFEQGFCR